jgi:hypothetical protein
MRKNALYACSKTLYFSFWFHKNYLAKVNWGKYRGRGNKTQVGGFS